MDELESLDEELLSDEDELDGEELPEDELDELDDELELDVDELLEEELLDELVRWCCFWGPPGSLRRSRGGFVLCRR